MRKLKIGILGSGDVGRILGAGFASVGHDVMMGTRDPGAEKVRKWVELTGERASAGLFKEAAEFAEVAVLATNWSGTESAIEMAHPDNLAHKVVIDATNPLKVELGSMPALAIGHTDSGGEQVQRWLPKSKVVKAFNIVGNAHMVKPSFPGGPPDMFICGNDDEAKKTVTGFLTEFGWNTIDFGGIDASRLLEPLCILWVIHGFRTKGWNHAFKLLHK